MQNFWKFQPHYDINRVIYLSYFSQDLGMVAIWSSLLQEEELGKVEIIGEFNGSVLSEIVLDSLRFVC